MAVRLESPIVLAHGLFGFNRIGVGGLTFTSYFRGVPEALRAAGNRVVATQVPPIAGVRLRATALGAAIAAAFPDEPVHLIGHSMGGLDARLLASDPAWKDRILSVTTIGTPHLGTALADFAKLRVGRIYRVLEALGIDHRGLLDVTRRVAREFHESVLVPDTIACFSLAGNPGEDALCWALRRPHAALTELEGPNDGLVSVASACAFGTPLTPWRLDHFRQMNWLTAPPRVGTHPPPIDLYSEVVANLGRHGFAALAADDQEARASA